MILNAIHVDLINFTYLIIIFFNVRNFAVKLFYL